MRLVPDPNYVDVIIQPSDYIYRAVLTAQELFTKETDHLGKGLLITRADSEIQMTSDLNQN